MSTEEKAHPAYAMSSIASLREHMADNHGLSYDNQSQVRYYLALDHEDEHENPLPGRVPTHDHLTYADRYDREEGKGAWAEHVAAMRDHAARFDALPGEKPAGYFLSHNRAFGSTQYFGPFASMVEVTEFCIEHPEVRGNTCPMYKTIDWSREI